MSVRHAGRQVLISLAERKGYGPLMTIKSNYMNIQQFSVCMTHYLCATREENKIDVFITENIKHTGFRLGLPH